MRIIKFRAWDKTDRCMYEIDKIKFHSNMSNPYTIFVDNQQLPEPVLMQFTGLYDVNGKEIFEGDVIKHRYFSMKGVAEVCWSTDEACFLAIEPNGARVVLRPNSEVIGNIWQNHRLLIN